MSIAPDLQPDFPIRSAPLPGGPPISGRDLYKQAVRKHLSDGIEEMKADRNVKPRHRLARHGEAQWDKASDRQWKLLPSVHRRRWDAESCRRWPRRGDDPTVPMDPVDVFCNSDEVHYVRGRKRPREEHPDWSEEYIRERYEEAYNALPASSAAPANLPLLGREVFESEARKIDTARGILSPGSARFSDARCNGYRTDEPSRVQLAGDIQNLHQAIDNAASQGKWKWHKKLGEGTFGTVMLYRWADANDQTLARVCVKRDKISPQDEERRHFKTLRDSGADCKYIVKYLGESRVPGRLGCTYLDYAPYGTLYELYQIHKAEKMAIPEPFLWYLLRCLAEAVAVLDGESLFHFDIKPLNILLGRADESGTSHHWHQNYPTVLLADLGGVNEKSQKAADHRGMGTEGFKPWELLRQNTQRECNRYRSSARGEPRPRSWRVPSGPKTRLPVDEKCGVHTSVWQIGQVILSGMRFSSPEVQLWALRPGVTPPAAQKLVYDTLCYAKARTDWPRRHDERRLDEQNHDMAKVAALKRKFFPGRTDKAIAGDPLFDALTLRAYRDVDNLHSSTIPKVSYSPGNALRPQYSARLVECVFRCLEPLPGDRPTIKDLLEEARDVCKADLERAWPGGGEMGGVAIGAGVEPNEKVTMRDVKPGPKPWRKREKQGEGEEEEEEEDEGGNGVMRLKCPMWLKIRRDKYPIAEKVLNDFYKAPVVGSRLR